MKFIFNIISGLFFILYLFQNQNVRAATCSTNIVPVLSIDGGGIRGIIPVTILTHIEKKLGYPIAKCFDVITGTSTGGIIALALNVPDSNGNPKFTAHELINLYKNDGDKIFEKSIWITITTFGGWTGPKYSAKNLELILNKYLQDTTLSQSLSDVVIPAFDLNKNKMKFFTKYHNKRHEEFYMRDIARATSAAPTYFPAFNLKSQKRDYRFIDAGVILNNPAIISYIRAIKDYYDTQNQIFVISLSTGFSHHLRNTQSLDQAGRIGWIQRILQIIMNGQVILSDQEMQLLFKKNNVDCQIKRNYIRLEPHIPAKYLEMDDTSKENIDKLTEFANQLIIDKKEDIDYIVKLLKPHCRK